MNESSREDEIRVSFVIPIYNEVEILEASVLELLAQSRARGGRFEIILAENGSRDGTLALAQRLANEHPELRVFSYPEPNYGGALREGIYRARGRFVVCEEIDLCDADFHERALDWLQRGQIDVVIGSKTMPGASDVRPLARRVATRAYNRVLRATLGFHGTDTHGLKAFVREAMVPIVAACVVEHDVFASELVIRAQRAGLRVLDIPVRIQEKRPPSIHLAKRVPRVAKNLVRLLVSIHVRDPRREGRTSHARQE